MRKYTTIAAAAALALSGAVARADFVYNTSRTSITSGMFAGDDVEELDIMNDGTHGTGTNLIAPTVTMQALLNGQPDPNGVFFIRTYNDDGTGIHNGGSPSTDPTDNDFDASGVGGESPLGTYVRFGPPSQWTLAGSDPEFLSSDDPGFSQYYGPQGPGLNYPLSGKYTDGMAVKGSISITVGANLTGGGLPDTTMQPLAFAVVPHGQPVQFTVNPIPSPEPAGVLIAVVGITGLLVHWRGSRN